MESEPSAPFEDTAFYTGSGGLPYNKAGIKVLRQSGERQYETVRHGWAVASETIVRCRDTGVKDGRGRPVYQDEAGTLFVWKYSSGSAEYFDSGVFEAPDMS